MTDDTESADPDLLMASHPTFLIAALAKNYWERDMILFRWSIIAGLWAALVATSAQAELYDDFERLEGPPYADALVAYAESYGIAEGDITAAIFEGRFAPHPADLARVVMEIDPRTCEEMAEKWHSLVKSLEGFNCEAEKLWPGTLGGLEWNRRFGAPTDEQRYAIILTFPKSRIISRQTWWHQKLDFEQAKDLPAVQRALADIQSYSIPGIIRSDLPNNEVGEINFAANYQRNRAAFATSSGNAVPLITRRTPTGPTIAEQVAQHRPGVLTPNERDIEQAIRAKMENALGAFDTMAQGCETYRRDNNPVAALGCLFSNGGTMTSDSARVVVQSVKIDHCTAMRDGNIDAICNYRVTAGMTGSGAMRQVASVFNMGQAFNEWTWAGFKRDRGTWRIVTSWNACTRTDTGYRCRVYR